MVTFTAHPTSGRMIEGFGPREKPTPTSPAIHYGQDWGWRDTTTDPIFAAAPGLVTAYADSGAYGRRMIVTHADGTAAWYCHTSRAVAALGERVQAGQEIARIGTTGNTTAPHLHFEYRVRGVAVDPAPHFDTAATAGGDRTPITEPEAEENDDMKTIQIHYTNARGELVRALVTPGTAYFMPWNEGNASDIANALAKPAALDTGSSIPVTESVYASFRAAAAGAK